MQSSFCTALLELYIERVAMDSCLKTWDIFLVNVEKIDSNDNRSCVEGLRSRS